MKIPADNPHKASAEKMAETAKKIFRRIEQKEAMAEKIDAMKKAKREREQKVQSNRAEA